MAITRGSELFAQSVTATSLTFAFNNVAGDALFVYGHDKASSATVVTGVTYAGSALTKIAELNGVATANDRAITSWRRIAPATGSNNVIVTASESVGLRFHASSYIGVHQTTPENGTDTSIGTAVTTLSTDITTTENDCWMVMFSKDQNGGLTYTNSTGDSVRLNADGGGHTVVDTNGSFATGANTVTNTMSLTSLGAIAWAIRPASGAVIVNPTVQSRVFSIPTYTPKTGHRISPATKSVIATVPAYTTKQGVRVSVNTRSATYAIPAYVVSSGSTVVAVGTKSVTFTIPAYSVRSHNILMPNGQTLTFTLPARTIVAVAHIVVTRTTLSLVFTTVGRIQVGAAWRKSSRNSSGVWTKISRNSD